MAEKFWTCRRQSGGVVCGYVNPKRRQICQRCSKRRPATKKPAHMSALDIPYEEYIKLNGGEHCGICGDPPKPGKKLQRDHDHRTSQPRGLLCFKDNLQLPPWVTPEWLEKAAAYLRRAAEMNVTGRDDQAAR